MNSKLKKILLISGLILLSFILFIAGQGDLQYKIDFFGNSILPLIIALVCGFTFFYILIKLVFILKLRMIYFFKISFFISLTLFTMTLPIINYCDGWQIRQLSGMRGLSEYLISISLISFFYFLFLAIIYLVNIILSVIKYLKKKDKVKNVFFSFSIPLIGLSLTIMFFVITNLYGLHKNGKCDIIIGPSDTGLSFVLFITIIINLIQYKISADNIGYKK